MAFYFNKIPWVAKMAVFIVQISKSTDCFNKRMDDKRIWKFGVASQGPYCFSKHIFWEIYDSGLPELERSKGPFFLK